MKKNGMSVIEVMIILVIVGILLSVIVPLGIHHEISGVVKQIMYDNTSYGDVTIVIFEDERVKVFQPYVPRDKFVLNKFNIITYNGVGRVIKVEVREEK